jgi:hypothetical protein
MLSECLRTLKIAERETRFSINAQVFSRKVTSHQKARRRFWRCGANLISPLGSLKSAIDPHLRRDVRHESVIRSGADAVGNRNPEIIKARDPHSSAFGIRPLPSHSPHGGG